MTQSPAASTGSACWGVPQNIRALKALAQEILRDWDAVVAFVYHPGLPPTNNEAERARCTCSHCTAD